LITVTLYTKDDCSLCKKAARDLKALQAEVPHTLASIDIETDAKLKKSFGHRVPVVQAGPYTLEAPFDKRKLLATLSAARDRQEQMASDPRYQKRREQGANLGIIDRFGQWMSRSYLKLILVFLAFYVGLPFAAPVLMNAGQESLARPIYSLYGFACHQLPFRSWFLFGEQAYYPRASADIEGVLTFQQASGLDEASGDPRDLLSMRGFIGNETMGYKVAYCQRDIAIYGAMLLFGLVFLASGSRIKPLHWMLWLAIGIAPIAFDGFSQLLSQPPFNLWEYRESTPLLRTVTGLLFGLTTAWFGFPLLDDSMDTTRVTIAKKEAHAAASKKQK
jgi:uncharacterized membrane protein